jgi:hypothetical protein
MKSCISEIFVEHGANLVYVSPSCWLQLQDHVLISNFTVQLDAVIKQYKWELDQVSFSPEEQAHSEEWLAVMDNESVGKSTLTTIQQLLVVECRSFIWTLIFSTLGILIIVLLAVIAGYTIFACHLLMLKQ